MKGDEFWSCSMGEGANTWKLDYDGSNATLWYKRNDSADSVLIPAEFMDRLALVWQQWRKIDESTNPRQPA
jgi:hypothetical protein